MEYTIFRKVIRQAGLLLVAVMLNGFVFATASTGVNGKEETEKKPETKTGTASWYGKGFQGKRTANGEVYDMNALTCASNHYPLGTWLRVTNIKSGKTVVVKVNDRMHPRMKRIIDLSRNAARVIGIENHGVGRVAVENLGNEFARNLP
jgi:rare lipoprotein A